MVEIKPLENIQPVKPIKPKQARKRSPEPSRKEPGNSLDNEKDKSPQSGDLSHIDEFA